MSGRLKSGDRVKWQYTHHFNRKSTAERVKKGEYYGEIKHTIRYKGTEQLCLVLFDGNKRISKVPVVDLIKEEKRK